MHGSSLTASLRPPNTSALRVLSKEAQILFDPVPNTHNNQLSYKFSGRQFVPLLERVYSRRRRQAPWRGGHGHARHESTSPSKTEQKEFTQLGTTTLFESLFDCTIGGRITYCIYPPQQINWGLLRERDLFPIAGII